MVGHSVQCGGTDEERGVGSHASRSRRRAREHSRQVGAYVGKQDRVVRAGEEVVVRRATKYSSRDIHDALFAPPASPSSPPRPRTLECNGLVTRVERRGPHGGKLSNIYDLSGLVGRLKSLEPDFRDVEERFKTARSKVAKPGYALEKQA